MDPNTSWMLPCTINALSLLVQLQQSVHHCPEEIQQRFTSLTGLHFRKTGIQLLQDQHGSGAVNTVTHLGKIWRPLHTTQGMVAQQQQEQQHQLPEGMHKDKIAPPRFSGEYSTFEEWKYKLTAYPALQDPLYNRLLRQSEQSQLSVANDQLETAAPSQARAGNGYNWAHAIDQHLQLADKHRRQRLRDMQTAAR